MTLAVPIVVLSCGWRSFNLAVSCTNLHISCHGSYCVLGVRRAAQTFNDLTRPYPEPLLASCATWHYLGRWTSLSLACKCWRMSSMHVKCFPSAIRRTQKLPKGLSRVSE